MVSFFRAACEQKGHYIWLNTHSQTLAAELRKEEFVAVNKIEGQTKIKQFKDQEFYDLQMDEAWLSGVMERGLVW
jgi:predicted ATPase